MGKELTDIIKRAAEVRDATLREENTAERVGRVLCDTLEYLCQALFLGGITTSADGTGFRISFTIHDSDGNKFTKDIAIPRATESACGLLTPQEKWKLNNVVNLGDVSTSAAGEAAGLDARYLFPNRPTVLQYRETARGQYGLLLSVPIDSTSHSQLLFLGKGMFRRFVHQNAGKYEADTYGWKRIGICQTEMDEDTLYLEDYDDLTVVRIKLGTWLNRVKEYKVLKSRLAYIEEYLRRNSDWSEKFDNSSALDVD